MNKVWFWGLAMGAAVGCGSASEAPQLPAKDPTSQPAKTPVEVAVDERVKRLVASEFPTLTNENAADFLTEWGTTVKEDRVSMDTKHGRIVVELFKDVPVHRANFLYKVHRRYFDPAEFTRVVPDFVVQGGNSEEERPQQLRFLIGQHTLPAEFDAQHIHTRGALAMSRSYHDNPDKRSSGYDFYIVTGRPIGPQELGKVQRDRGVTYTTAQAQAYAKEGGAPHLDGEHTVFGRVVEGMEVVDKLAATPRDESDWPLTRLEVRMEWAGDSFRN